ncbi:MAG TPA: hypothetical protein VF668_10950, partial [Pyrinomonadaceae bacterium]
MMLTKNTRGPKRSRLLPLLAALCLCAAADAAGARRERGKRFEPTSAQAAEAARMRRALAATLGDDFEVTRERLARRSDWHGGGLYWLAHLRARRPGEFDVTYKYRYTDRVRPHDPLYTFVEHRTLVRVGPRGCERRARHNFVCVGDTLILPVLVNEHTGHVFSIAARPFAPGDAASAMRLRDATDGALFREPVFNPAEKYMKYVGRRATYSPHRALGYTVTYEATFEAAAPGAFNLSVTEPADAGGPQSPDRDDGAGSVPVVVVARGAPGTVLSSGDDVHGYTERFSSRGGGNGYRTTPVILQTGERLTLRYFGYSRRGPSAGGEDRRAVEAGVKRRAPAVALLPF